MRRNPRHQPRKEEVALHRINDKIIATEIRLILEGEEPVVMSVSKALLMAEQQELDLVEISPNAKIPVCKILDYKKFLYNQKRKQKELKAKQSKIVVKAEMIIKTNNESSIPLAINKTIYSNKGSKVKV